MEYGVRRVFERDSRQLSIHKAWEINHWVVADTMAMSGPNA